MKRKLRDNAKLLLDFSPVPSVNGREDSMDAAVQLREEGFFIAKGIVLADVPAACKTAMTRQTDTLLSGHHQHQGRYTSPRAADPLALHRGIQLPK